MTEPLKARRFELREVVTFLAAAFTFGGALGLMGVAIAGDIGALVMPDGSLGIAREAYIDVLPIATLIIGFWFNGKAQE